MCDSDGHTCFSINVLNADIEPSSAWEGTHLLSVLVFCRIGMFTVNLLHNIRLCTMECVMMLYVLDPFSLFVLMITFLTVE